MSKCPHLPAQDPAVSTFEFDPRNRRESFRWRQLSVNSKADHGSVISLRT
jgi:predicted RNA-binding protein with PUA-like domain